MMRSIDCFAGPATMSELGRYLATYYLPHTEPDVFAVYRDLVRPPVSARHMTYLHLHMWSMALVADDFDLERVQAALRRRRVSGAAMAAVDDLVLRRLSDLVASHGADRRDALYAEAAMAYAALNVSAAAAPA
jgi:hypothetical protein